MKITKVDVIMAKIDVPVSDGWHPVFCRIYTDEGIYGDGEAAVTYMVGARSAFGMLHDLAEMIIGMDPMENEVIWDHLYKNTFWCQNGGPMTFAAMSAIDIARWDIKGKALNRPLYALLGGKFRSELRAYASQLQLSGWRKNYDDWKIIQTPQEYFDAAKRAIAEGYDCIKTDFFCGEYKGEPLCSENRTRLLSADCVKFVEERIAATREAVGDRVDIIMENHCFTDALSASQLGRLAEKYNIFYFEESVTPIPKLQEFVGRHLHVPMASGERTYSRWQYIPYFESGTLQVIQPDIGNCGGLTEAKKICDMAYAYDISVQAHVCASPLSTDVAVHLETAIPNFQIHEHHICHESNRNKDLAIRNNLPVNGKIKPSELPGIGNEIHPRVFKENLMFVTVK